jgi:hypothetical protein
MIDFVGAPAVTRTRGPQFRKLLLYPPELQAHPFVLNSLAKSEIGVFGDRL